MHICATTTFKFTCGVTCGVRPFSPLGEGDSPVTALCVSAVSEPQDALHLQEKGSQEPVERRTTSRSRAESQVP